LWYVLRPAGAPPTSRPPASRLRAIGHATAALRSRVGVLDRVDQLEELIDLSGPGRATTAPFVESTTSSMRTPVVTPPVLR
jgi:hypothetical protein